MKRYLTIISLVTLLAPVVVLAQPALQRPKLPRPSLTHTTATQLPKHNGFNKTQQLPKELAQKPADLGSGLSQHAKILQFRLDHITTSQIPADKIDQVKADIQTELDWITTMESNVAAAATVEDKAALQQEIISHVQQVRQARQQKLSQAVTLPSTSPFDRAESLETNFQQALQHFENELADTTALEQAMSDYTAAVTTGQAAYDAAQSDKTLANLTALRDAMAAVHDQASVVRNSIQSLLEQTNTINN